MNPSSRGSSRSCISKRTIPSRPPPKSCTPSDHTEHCSLFQLPVFVLGARGLWRGKPVRTFGCASRVYREPWFSDSPGIYALLVLYGASTATTTLACIAAIIDIPTTSAATIAQKVISLTSQQRVLLLVSYIPFCIIPLVIAVDMAFRLQKLAYAGVRAQESSKEK